MLIPIDGRKEITNILLKKGFHCICYQQYQICIYDNKTDR